MLVATAIVAMHFVSFPAEASTGGSKWAGLLYLTPTMMTCLLHIRLRLRTTSAMAVHYVTTAAWTFLHAVGVNFAINAQNHAHASPGRKYQLLVYSDAWNDTVGMLGWGIALAATYGIICYTAVSVAGHEALLMHQKK
jgi:hypothetical protein